MFGKLKKCCLNCFFCSKDISSVGMQGTVTLKEEERCQIKQGDFSFLERKNIGDASLTCGENIWSEGAEGTDAGEIRKQLNSFKCGRFYSFKKSKNKLFHAARKELEERKQKVLLVWTVVAAISAIIAALPVVINFIK